MNVKIVKLQKKEKLSQSFFQIYYISRRKSKMHFSLLTFGRCAR